MGNVWERYGKSMGKVYVSYTEKTLQVRMIILQKLYSVLLENPKRGCFAIASFFLTHDTF
jgi:hypothetical protein